MSKKSGRAGRAALGARRRLPADAEIPVVPGRADCPCGSGLRYKSCHGRGLRQEATRFVERPFAGLPGECDWVALRELVPAATATVRLAAGAEGVAASGEDPVEVTVATVLPMAWPAMRRADGVVFLGLQTTTGSGDPSRDAAAALLRAVAADPGTPVPPGDLPGPGPRLQDVLDPDVPFEVTLHEDFDFWLQDPEDVTPEVRESLERANSVIVPTRAVPGARSAYWCRLGDRFHLRWVLPFEEGPLLDGLARLHAGDGSSLVPGGRYAGAFRAHGLVIPVWDLPEDVAAEDLAEPVREFDRRLREAMAETAPLNVAERLARAGVVSRQLTLR